MNLIADVMLAAGAFGAALYCYILQGRLQRFTALESGMGGAIAVLSAQVDDMTRALEKARGAASGSAAGLEALTARAEAGVQLPWGRQPDGRAWRVGAVGRVDGSARLSGDAAQALYHYQSRTDPDSPMIWRGPIVMSAITQLLNDAEWGTAEDPLDILIIDTPPGTGDAQLAIAQKVPVTAAIIVTTPQEVALADVRRGAAMFAKTHVPVIGIAADGAAEPFVVRVPGPVPVLTP